jgi:hypothetical protein
MRVKAKITTGKNHREIRDAEIQKSAKPLHHEVVEPLAQRLPLEEHRRS